MNQFINCSICQDKKNFRLKVQDAQRILYRLKEISRIVPYEFQLSQEDIYDSKNINYQSHIHFMCGYCHETNMQELYYLEKQILMESYRLYAYTKQDSTDLKDKEKIEDYCQQLLSGFYPNIATLFC